MNTPAGNAVPIIPNTWLDPLLSGPNAVLGKPPYDCGDIERLLNALTERESARTPLAETALRDAKDAARWRFLSSVPGYAALGDMTDAAIDERIAAIARDPRGSGEEVGR